MAKRDSSTLGNTTEFSSRSDFTGEYGYTALRFYLLEIARQLLPNERINTCWRWPLPARKTVEIIYSDERQCARTKGTMKCGSGWVCPACMSYISQQRRIELSTAIERKSEDWWTVMATFTSQHTAGDRLDYLLKGMIGAYGAVCSGRSWQLVKSDYMLKGSVRATEITHGKNGWHPHFHVLYFVDKKMLNEDIAGSPEEFSQSLRNQLGAQWLEALEKRGLTGLNEIALDVRTGDKYIADYIAKFGKMPSEWAVKDSAYEITHSVTKTAQKGGFGVLDILFASVSSEKYKGLFLEYHAATKGRSALQWSQGLKAALDIEVIRDEIAAQGVETETDRILAEIDTFLWRIIADRGHLGQVMTIANTGDEKKLNDFIDKLMHIHQVETLDLSLPEIGH